MLPRTLKKTVLCYLGSEGPGCDSQGQCVCKRGVQGTQCDRCANGSPITATGCEPLQWVMDDAYSYSSSPVILYVYHWTEFLIVCRKKSCFCNGHSNECSSAQGYSVYNIISTFDQGESEFMWVKLHVKPQNSGIFYEKATLSKYRDGRLASRHFSDCESIPSAVPLVSNTPQHWGHLFRRAACLPFCSRFQVLLN